MTFADSVLHLVRSGARIETWSGSDTSDSAAAVAPTQTDEIAEAAALTDADMVADQGQNLIDIEMAAQAAQADHEFEPALGDLEAAVALVSGGLATRVVLSGFQSWPGLLWRAYQLADTTGVLILPTVVRPGGKVDIVITRDPAANG